MKLTNADESIEITAQELHDQLRDAHNEAIEACIDLIKHCSHEDGLGMGSHRMESEMAKLRKPA